MENLRMMGNGHMTNEFGIYAKGSKGAQWAKGQGRLDVTHVAMIRVYGLAHL